MKLQARRRQQSSETLLLLKMEGNRRLGATGEDPTIIRKRTVANEEE